MSPHIAELADTLWYERRLLEFLLFKLVSANLVLVANDQRFVAPAIAEVERVMEEVRNAELDRHRILELVAADWAVPATDLSLEYLANHVTGEYADDFVDHRNGFMHLVNEIEELTRENRRLATVGIEHIRGTLGLVETVTYDATGKRGRVSDGPAAVNRVL